MQVGDYSAPMNIRSWFARDVWSLPPPLWLLITATFAAVMLALTTPRAMPLAYFGLVATLVLTAHRRGVDMTLPALPGWLGAGLMLAAYVLLSAIWSQDAPSTLLVAGLIVGLLISAQASRAVADRAPLPWLEHTTRTILVAGILAILFLLVEQAFGHPIKRALFWPFRAARVDGGTLALDPATTVVIQEHMSNWNMPPLAFLLWPLLLICETQLAGRDRRLAQGAILAAGLVTVFLSRHWTSMFAVVAGVCVLAASFGHARGVARVMQAAWLAAFVAVVPLASTAFSNEMHLAERLKPSLRARIILWGVTAERFWQHPLLGVGAAATRRADHETYREAEARRPSNYTYALRTGPHAHNIELQSLYELGVAGTVLLALFGLVVIEAVSRAGRHARPYLMAATATIGVMGLSSFGLFEPWFMAAFAMTALAGTLATAYQRRLSTGSEQALAEAARSPH